MKIDMEMNACKPLSPQQVETFYQLNYTPDPLEKIPLKTF